MLEFEIRFSPDNSNATSEEQHASCCICSEVFEKKEAFPAAGPSGFDLWTLVKSHPGMRFLREVHEAV